MPLLKDYRLYILDAKGRIARAEVLSLASEEEALAAARERARTGKPVEVWHGSAMLAHVPADEHTVEHSLQ